MRRRIAFCLFFLGVGIVVLLFCFGGGGARVGRREVGAGEDAIVLQPVAQPSPAKDPATVASLLATVENGDPDASARALVELAPDGWAVARGYEGIIHLAESAGGGMNLEILYDACTGYHRWHSVVINDDNRGAAILQWISQKIWEMPSGKEKSALVARYFDDLNRLVQSGRLPTKPTLELARKTVAWRDIRPESLGTEYFRLIKTYASAGDPKLRDFVRRECLSFPPVCYGTDDEGDRVFEFVRQSFPDAKGYTTAEAFRTRYLELRRVDDSIGRSEYDAIPLLKPSQWSLEDGASTSFHLSLGTMRYLLGWMLDRYDSAPDAANRTIATWIRDIETPYSYGYYRDAFVGQTVYGPAMNKSHPIDLPEGVVDTLVNGLVETNNKTELDSISAAEIHYVINELMKDLALRDKGACSAKTVERQKLILESQLNSIFVWERIIVKHPPAPLDSAQYEGKSGYDAYGKRVRVNFIENQALYCPGAKLFLKAKAQALLKDKSAYRDLPQPAQIRIEKMLKDLLTMQ